MSYELAGLVSRKQCGGAMRKCLLFTLAGRANNDGSGIYASIPTLAVDAEMSERSVQMHIRDFLAEGLLCVTGKHKVPRGHTTVYAIVVASLEALPDLDRRITRAQHVVSRGENAAPQDTISTGAGDAPVQEMRGRGANPAQRPVQELHPNLSMEPIQEPIQRAPVREAFETAWKRWPKFRASDKAKSWERWKRAYDPNLLGAIEVYLRSPDAMKPDRDTGKPHGYVPAFEVWLNGKHVFWLERLAETAALPQPSAALQAEFRAKWLAAGRPWNPEWGPQPEAAA